jgi:hypothetical protein
MRRFVGWIAGALGGITAYRLLRRRPLVAPEPAPAVPDERAEELRTKLAESRAEPAVEEPPIEPALGEEPAAEPPESPDDRRRRVHEEGRAAIDDMQSE